MASTVFFKSLVHVLIILNALYTIIEVSLRGNPTPVGGVKWWSVMVTVVNVLVIMFTLILGAYATCNDEKRLLRTVSMVIGGYGVFSIWARPLLVNFYLAVALGLVGYELSENFMVSVH